VNITPWVDELCRDERLPAAYGESVHRHVAKLAGKIAALHRTWARAVVVGICGAQGSGKSTLALFLENWLSRECGLAATTLSLDDLYLGKQERHRQITD
jgi:D-glycerate 3-kinase